jgi:hypothetical protein
MCTAHTITHSSSSAEPCTSVWKVCIYTVHVILNHFALTLQITLESWCCLSVGTVWLWFNVHHDDASIAHCVAQRPSHSCWSSCVSSRVCWCVYSCTCDCQCVLCIHQTSLADQLTPLTYTASIDAQCHCASAIARHLLLTCLSLLHMLHCAMYTVGMSWSGQTVIWDKTRYVLYTTTTEVCCYVLVDYYTVPHVS